ncbi:hypothetical protein KW782_04715 [Candidatus Parcubacteria bacterium]|nr:hypothetical protein [Candidatus Parcubacteria bacterium]
MMDKLRQFFIEGKLKRIFKRDLSASRTDTLHAKLAFMSEIQRQFPFTEQPHQFGWANYAFAALAGIFILNGGALLYADTVDVPADHPLYSYKLVAEEVKVLASSAEAKPKVEVKLAERRIKELKQLQASSPIASSTASTTIKIKNTNQDSKAQKQLKESIKKQLELVEKSQIKTKTSMVCNDVTKIQEQITEFFTDESSKIEINQKITNICNTEQKQTSERKVEEQSRQKQREEDRKAREQKRQERNTRSERDDD